MVTSILEKEIKIEGAGRKQWPNKLQFLCANISYAVGLGKTLLKNFKIEKK